MVVLKRDGRAEPIYFDKIISRIEKLCYGLEAGYMDIEIAATMTTKHPDYAILAARIELSCTSVASTSTSGSRPWSGEVLPARD